jgi:hypothetical protein
MKKHYYKSDNDMNEEDAGKYNDDEGEIQNNDHQEI